MSKNRYRRRKRQLNSSGLPKESLAAKDGLVATMEEKSPVEREALQTEAEKTESIDVKARITQIVTQLENYSNLSYLSLWRLTRNHVPAVNALLATFRESISSQTELQQIQWLHAEISALNPRENGATHGILAQCTSLLNEVSPQTVAGPVAIAHAASAP